MTTRGLLACLVLVSSSVGTFMACNLETSGNYGNPSGLSHDHFPVTNIDGSAPGTDAGALCNGAGPIDGGLCTVKFSTDIWPLMAATGKWACADSNCHGGTALNPFINDPASAYANLTTYKVAGKPYVNPCTIDIDASSFVCNLQGACGTQAMPIPDMSKGRTAAQPGDIGKVVQWQQCGAPFN